MSFDAISNVLQNQFLSGGIVLMVAASVIALCRKLPLQIWLFLLRRFTIVVDISNDDPLFTWVSLWLSEHPYSKRARVLTATSERDDYGRISPSFMVGDLPNVLFVPAPGNHLLWYKRRLVWLSRERKDTAGKDESLISLLKREVFTFRIVGRSQSTARDLLESARATALNRRCKKIEVFSPQYDSWQRIDERDPRPLSSVFLPEGITEKVVDDLSAFLNGQAWYAERGVPWRRAYMFHGVPGSGKTSLICALAGQFRMNLYLLNLGNPYLSDDALMRLMSLVPSRSFLLLEDIDAAFDQRKKVEGTPNKLTFSGLLNALDGAGSKEGSVVFLTTNHLEHLDPALIRSGRADFHVEFSAATAEQANRMFLAFFPDVEGADGFGDAVEVARMNMADVQNHLIKHRDSQVLALNAIKAGGLRAETAA